jgi:two-component system chemotaxis response regulator CheB
MEPIRVLVVDDSAFMRRAIQKMLENDQDIEVVGRARNGKEALDEIRRLKPDVVTLNLVMPEMDGLTALKTIMAEMPLPVVIVSASAEEGSQITMDALSAGAVDFVTKPTAEISFDIYAIGQTLIEKVKASTAKFSSYKREKEPLLRSAQEPGQASSKEIRALLRTDIIKVLVVDDSDVMRAYISELLEFDQTIKVVGTAYDGEDAIHKVEALKPDVMTLDLKMPRMDGFAVLEYIMKRNPIPVVVISSHAIDASSSETIRALELGAVDFSPVKSAVSGEVFKRIHKELIEKVKAAASVDVGKLKIMREIPISTSSSFLYDGTFSFPLNKGGQGVVRKRKSLEGKVEVVTIGASTGGPQALEAIITSFPANFPATVLVAQHMPANFTFSFAQRLNEKSHLTVREAKMKDMVEPGVALIAPGDYNMEVIKNLEKVASVVISEGESMQTIKPSVDLLMKSAANVFGARSVGVLLTGMGRDGAEGMKAIKNAGGITIAQDESSSLIFGMPKAAIETGCVDETLPLEKIAQKIIEIV